MTCLASVKPWVLSPVPHKTRYGDVCMPTTPALTGWRQWDQKFKTILGYRPSLRPAWVVYINTNVR